MPLRRHLSWSGSDGLGSVRRSWAGLPHQRRVTLRARRCESGVGLAVLLVMCARAGALLLAQDAPALRLTLDEARQRAVDTSHRLAEIRAREAGAQSVVDARLAMDRPNIVAIAGYTRTNHVNEFVVPGPTGVPRALYPDVPDNYRTRLDVQWPIYTGGRTDALQRAAGAEARAVAAEGTAARADLRLEATRAYWALVTSRAAVDVIDRGLARVQAHVSDVRARLQAGVVPPNELASAQAQDARQRMLLIEARNQRDLAAAEVARLIGADPSQPLEPASTLEEGATPASAGQGQAAETTRDRGVSAGEDARVVDALVTEGRDARGERQALGHRIAAAEEQRLAAMAGKRPILAVAGGVDYARPNPRIFPRARQWQESWDAGITLNWSLWDGGRVAADAAQAASQSEVARQRLAEFDSVLALEVRQRRLEIDSGRAAVAAAAEAIRAAAEAHRVVTERYRVGVIAQSDVLDAEVSLLQAELDRTRALAGVRLAQARLDRSVGR